MRIWDALIRRQIFYFVENKIYFLFCCLFWLFQDLICILKNYFFLFLCWLCPIRKNTGVESIIRFLIRILFGATILIQGVPTILIFWGKVRFDGRCKVSYWCWGISWYKNSKCNIYNQQTNCHICAYKKVFDLIIC